MSATTLTSKGQITLPKSIRDRLALKVGDGLGYRPTGTGESPSTASADLRPATSTGCSSAWPRLRLHRSATCEQPCGVGLGREFSDKRK